MYYMVITEQNCVCDECAQKDANQHECDMTKRQRGQNALHPLEKRQNHLKIYLIIEILI